MNKRDLSKIYHINKEIQMWQNELDVLAAESLVKSPGFDEMPAGSFNPISKQETRAISKMTIEQTIRGLQSELIDTRAELTEWIATIDDSYVRQILYHRCVKALSWQEVCDAMDQGSADGVRMVYERFVKKNFPHK